MTIRTLAVASILVLSLAGCGVTGGGSSVNQDLTTACKDYDTAKALVALVPLPQVQILAAVIEAYVDPVCDGSNGPVMLDANTPAWVRLNISNLLRDSGWSSS